MNVLLTGDTGFVGSSLLQYDHANSYILFSEQSMILDGVAGKARITAAADYGNLFDGIEVVVHCAARVHVMDDQSADPLAAFRAVNTQGTVNLARQAAAAGVKRFIFISTIKVNGEFTEADQAFRHDDIAQPCDPYGLSKWEAEQSLMQLSNNSGMELVIIRPPLVYGKGVKGNFCALSRIACRGVPLPLGGINNRRSLVFVDNLADLIVTCLAHSEAAGETFLVSDGMDLSLSDLLINIAEANRQHLRLLPLPIFCRRLMTRIAPGIAQRLFTSLVVDISHTQKTLGWQPPFSVSYGLAKTV
ncbi:N-acetyl-alpha-D-glucosaminyl-diphospho-ditrans, octacis-undecaprenol 4-epimerase [Sinobacterium norvegicum]|uniref:N-acetyl-alpha-D-glucosaminyl-diphospho-ditrans, octacis-undecaprenol 4-epimerase n=1 Tax=Sinobacterium norvegicum TaxID=1641715 RepID=A0ABM9AFQ3_9GAMM|nr:SDR family oxidoreductase [Sinobacterium norvegicum]CAH0992026.1 N-acetyl-alpha-D-glucosaminyl-diphospho-ditrans, octacis-undecaprenol 4-epimerase [Sinobacterium norvegicum]